MEIKPVPLWLQQALVPSNPPGRHSEAISSAVSVLFHASLDNTGTLMGDIYLLLGDPFSVFGKEAKCR